MKLFRKQWFLWLSVVLIVLCLTTIALGNPGRPSARPHIRLNPIPEYMDAFSDLSRGGRATRNALIFLVFNGLGNIVVFVPLGAALYAALRHMQGNRLLLVTLVGAQISLFFELVQLWMPGRVTATDDLITNTVGTFIGALIAQLLWYWWRRRRSALQVAASRAYPVSSSKVK
jgi:glycopeptide antibiotics resistance protein